MFCIIIEILLFRATNNQSDNDWQEYLNDFAYIFLKYCYQQSFVNVNRIAKKININFVTRQKDILFENLNNFI